MNDIQLAQLSNNVVAAAIAVLSVALLGYAVRSATARSVRGQDRPVLDGHLVSGPAPAGGWSASFAAHSNRWADSLVVIGTALIALGLLTRGLSVGRVPWGNMYEFTLAAALAACVALIVSLRQRVLRPLAVWVVALIVLALGLAVTVLYTPAGELVPVLDSYWLVVHVAAAIIAGGILTLGFVSAVAYLERSRRRAETADVVPARVELDRVSYTLHLVAFPIWTFAVIAGAIWAENAWGRYWGWDPKETWAFITWVLYAAYLHAQATPRWRGRRAAFLAVTGYMAFLFNFFGVNLWISGLHSYAGV